MVRHDSAAAGSPDLTMTPPCPVGEATSTSDTLIGVCLIWVPSGKSDNVARRVLPSGRTRRKSRTRMIDVLEFLAGKENKPSFRTDRAGALVG